jgi:hypothetical protein
MKLCRNLALVALALVFAGNEAGADCTLEGPALHVARIQLTSCEPAVDHAAEVLSKTRLPWLESWLGNRIANEQGVVFSGTVVEAVGVAQYADHDYSLGDAHESAYRGGRWFFASSNPRQCEAWKGAPSIIVLLAYTCCDVIPPSDVPCLLNIGSARPVPTELQGVLKP